MSLLWKLSKSDILNGLLVSVLGAMLTIALELLSKSGLDWSLEDGKKILIGALVTGISYLLKKLSQDGEGKVLGKYKI